MALTNGPYRDALEIISYSMLASQPSLGCKADRLPCVIHKEGRLTALGPFVIMVAVGSSRQERDACQASRSTMRGCQRVTLLLLLCAVIVVFWTLFQLLRGAVSPPASTPSAPLVLHTPTSTATMTSKPLPGESKVPASSPTAEPRSSASPALAPSASPTSTPVPPSPTAVPPTHTSTPAPTATSTPRPSPTPLPQPTLPPEVLAYLDRFVPLVVSVEGEGILSNPGGIDQAASDRLRAYYRRLHEMTVPPDAEEMHLAFIVYTSVLEEKCLCHVFAQAHAADAQAQYFRGCESRATRAATDAFTNRFLPARDAFLRSYSLTANEAGFP